MQCDLFILPSYGSNYWELLCLGIEMGKNDWKGQQTSIPLQTPSKSTSTSTSTSTGTNTYTEVSGLPCSTLSSSGRRREREKRQGSCSQSCKAVRWQLRVNGKQRQRHVHKVQASGADDPSGFCTKSVVIVNNKFTETIQSFWTLHDCWVCLKIWVEKNQIKSIYYGN